MPKRMVSASCWASLSDLLSLWISGPSSYQLGRTPSADDRALIALFLKTLTGEWEGKPL